MLVAFVIVGAVAGLLLAQVRQSTSSRSVEWELGDLDPVTAQTATVIPISVEEYPPKDCYAPADSWLATPRITYTYSSVIITLEKTDAYIHGHCTGLYTTSWSGSVQLSEPLRGRALLDGSRFPPERRPLRSAIANLLILGISDWRGQVEPLSGIGGAAALATYFDNDRAAAVSAGGGILTLTAGNDVGGPSSLSTFFQDTPAILSERMMGVMIGGLGNHNFDAGIGRLQSQIDMAFADASDGDSRFHYVASNLSDRDANIGDVQDYEIFRFGDAKVAFIGVVNEKGPTPVGPGSLGTMTRTGSVAAAMAAKASAGAAGADVFIAITDMGVTGVNGADPAGDLIDFSNAVTGFDVIFGGDTDIQYSGTINGQLVVENRSRGMTYSKTYLTYDRLAAQVTVSNTFVTPTAASVTPDPRVVAMLGTYQGEMSFLLDGSVGNAAAAPPPITSPSNNDKSAACVAAESRVPAYARRLAGEIASLRPLVVAERFDTATTASAIRQLDLTLTSFAEIDPPYHGCDTSSGLAYDVEYLVARASRMIEMSDTPGITKANPQQRLVFDLYGYLPEALALVYTPAPLPTPAPTP